MCFKIFSSVSCVYQVFDYFRKPDLLNIKKAKSFLFFGFFFNNWVTFCMCLWNLLIVTLVKWTAKCCFTVTPVIQFSQVFKPFGIFDNFPKSNSKWSLFDPRLTLIFPKWPLENLKGFVSLWKERCWTNQVYFMC